MALIRSLYFNATDGFHQEAALTDTMQLGGLTLTGQLDMSTNKVTNLGTPTADTDAATKAYVDAVTQGLDIKASMRVATDVALPANTRTGNVLTASANGSINTAGIDGVTTLALNDRVLVKNESSGDNNGLYFISDLGSAGSPWTLTRTLDADASSEVTPGLFTFVEEGTTNADTGWVLSTNAPITLNTTALTFTQFSGAGAIVAGAGLTRTGNTLDVGDGAGINVSADKIAVELATDPALEFDAVGDAGKLRWLAAPSGGLERVATGGAIKLDGTTLTTSSSGAKVRGLPALFEVAGVAVGAAVTASNLDTLTNGSNADALHSHAAASATEAPKLENTLAVNEAIAIADPVYITGTNDRVGKARADTTAKRYVIGLARTAQSTVGNTCEVVSMGIAAGVLSGATAGTRYWLSATGGITTSIPGAGSGNSRIQVGVAINATDLWVHVIDYGKA